MTREATQHWCPICDAGWVEQVRIEPAGSEGWLCGECEAFWPTNNPQAVFNEPFVQFGPWVREEGLESADFQVIRPNKRDK